MYACICVSLQGDGIRNVPSSILQANPVSSPKIPLLSRHLKKIWGMETVSSKLTFSCKLVFWCEFCSASYHLTEARTAAASKISGKTFVTLCVSYLPLFLPQNPAAVVSRTGLGEIKKRSPLQWLCLLSCWTGQQSFLCCEKIPATLENRRPRPCNSQAFGPMAKTETLLQVEITKICAQIFDE